MLFAGSGLCFVVRQGAVGLRERIYGARILSECL